MKCADCNDTRWLDGLGLSGMESFPCSCRTSKVGESKMRLRYAFDFKVYFWTWDTPLGHSSVFYDGWNNQVNIGLIRVCWTTPPLKGD